MKKYIIFIIIITFFMPTFVYGKSTNYSYRVLLGVKEKKLEKKAKGAEIIIIDAQMISKRTINKIRKKGCKVYSYLNIGSLETFRLYYKTYKPLIIGKYENWSDEFWVDVSKEKWRKFIVDEIGRKIANKKVDGFFLDNADVYENYRRKNIYDGLNGIIKGLKKYKHSIIVNGGDFYIKKLILNKRHKMIFAINQECVYSRITNYKKGKFRLNSQSRQKYYFSYLKRAKKEGLKIFVLEYSKNLKHKKYIQRQCKKRKYNLYIANNLNLD